MNNSREPESDFIEAVNDFFYDHYNNFNCYPMEFEYMGLVYDFDDCICYVRERKA